MFASASLLLSILLAQPPVDAYALQHVGTFHAGEADARDGEIWLALVEGAAGFALKEIRVQVRAVEDPLFDAEGETSGLEVAAPELANAPLALLRGPGLVARSILGATGTRPTEAGFLPDVPVALDPAADEHLLLQCAPDAMQTAADPLACELRLRRADASQVLYRVAATAQAEGGLMIGDEGHLQLLFAGDLDGDGRTDLLMGLSDHYNVGRSVLFLSGAAGAGELVGEAAVQETTGC